MTQLLTNGGLANAFRGSTDAAAYQKFFARQQEEQRSRRERNEELRGDEAELMDMTLAVISSAETREFRIELDSYDVATVEALHTNEIELVRAQLERDKLFAKAHVLPDGRHVFKTEDGLRVFDENGLEMSNETIEADAIDDSRPRWEAARPIIETHNALVKERDELLDYQSKLDDARERLDRGDLNRKEFDELREELNADMPDAVRGHVPGMEARDTPTAEAAELTAEELDITDDMVPTRSAAKAFAPSLSG